LSSDWGPEPVRGSRPRRSGRRRRDGPSSGRSRASVGSRRGRSSCGVCRGRGGDLAARRSPPGGRRKEVFELRDDSPREQATATGAAYSAVTFFPVTQMGRIEPYAVEFSFPAWPAMMAAICPRTPLSFSERHARSHAPSQVIRPSARLNRQYRQQQCHTAEVIARGGEVRAVCQERYAEDSGTLR